MRELVRRRSSVSRPAAAATISPRVCARFAMTEFHSTLPWSPDRPQTLVVCCSDGRYHAQIEDFVRREVSERADLFAIPGGPACIDPWTSSFDEARVFEQSMRLFAAAHDLSAVWLMAHEDCAYYRVKHPGCTATELRELQWRDLRRARELVRSAHPAYGVRCVFVARTDERVVFHYDEAQAPRGR